MIDFDKFLNALAMTESNDDTKAWGDEGLAVGRFQMHPAFVWDYGPDTVGVVWSWDHVFRETLRNFLAEREPIHNGDAVHIVMEFHLGVSAVSKGQWDKAYAERFARFYA